MARRFIGNYERRLRIEGMMRARGMVKEDGDVSWYALAKEMNVYLKTLLRSLRSEKYCTKSTSVQMIKAAAKALDVPAGYLIDKK